jgi:hypothetical protein
MNTFISYFDAWEQFVKRHSVLGVSPSRSAADGFVRRYGAKFIKDGVMFQASSRRYFVPEFTAFENAVLYVLTRGAMGQAPGKKPKQATPAQPDARVANGGRRPQ